MTDRLSRERIAELRDAARNYLHNERGSQFWRDILVVIDAYEAQRPRPASEAPDVRTRVCGQARDGRILAVTYYGPDAWIDDTGRYRDITAWWPLPPIPERDDG